MLAELVACLTKASTWFVTVATVPSCITPASFLLIGPKLLSAELRTSFSVLLRDYHQLRAAETLTDLVHSTNGSWTKASSTLISESLLVRRISRAISAAFRKTPGISSCSRPLTLDTGDSHRIHHIMCKPEWNPFRDLESFALP